MILNSALASFTFVLTTFGSACVEVLKTRTTTFDGLITSTQRAQIGFLWGYELDTCESKPNCRLSAACVTSPLLADCDWGNNSCSSAVDLLYSTTGNITASTLLLFGK